MSQSIAAESESADANPAKESLKIEQEKQRKAVEEHGEDAELTKALEDTFPASDPVAVQTPSKPGSSD